MNYEEVIARWRHKHAEYVGDNPIGIVGAYSRKMDVGDDRSIWLTANTDDIDGDREVVEPKGSDPSYYFAKNKQVFADHRYLLDDAVAVARSIVPRPNNKDIRGWDVHVHVYDKKGSQLGNDILTMAKAAAIGCSIGFVRIAGGKPTPEEVVKYTRNGEAPEIVTRKWGWIELSFTARPCNVSCQSHVMKAMDTRFGVIDNLLVKGAIKPASAAAVGFELKQRRRVVCMNMAG